MIYRLNLKSYNLRLNFFLCTLPTLASLLKFELYFRENMATVPSLHFVVSGSIYKIPFLGFQWAVPWIG
jgi:hypothetical protein